MVHPLLAVILLSEAVATFAALYWGWGAFRLLTAQASGIADSKTLRIDRLDDAARLAGRGAHVFFTLSLVLLILSVASVLPGMIPGTMCGTGVLQAMYGEGTRAILARILLLVLLSAWQAMRRLDEASPPAGLKPLVTRFSLLTVTVGILSSWQILRAVFALDISSPQDCCAAVRDAASSGSSFTFPNTGLVLIFSFTSIGLLAGATLLRYTRRHLKTAGTVTAIAALGFIPTAALSLVRIFSPYHFGSLSHHCFWCLFAWRHHAVGFPLFAALMLISTETAALITVLRLQKIPEIKETAERRARQAALRLATAGITFVVIAVLPSVLWRIRFGVWMNT